RAGRSGYHQPARLVQPPVELVEEQTALNQRALEDIVAVGVGVAVAVAVMGEVEGEVTVADVVVGRHALLRDEAVEQQACGGNESRTGVDSAARRRWFDSKPPRTCAALSRGRAAGAHLTLHG